MRCVEYNIDTPRFRDSRNLAHRNDNAVAVGQMRQQQQPSAGRVAKDALIRGQNVGCGVRFRKVKCHKIGASRLGEPAHRMLHLVIVDVGHDCRIACLQRHIIRDQPVERFSSSGAQRDLLGFCANQSGDRVGGRLQAGIAAGTGMRTAQEKRIVTVHPLTIRAIPCSDSPGHRAVVGRIEIDDAAIDLVASGKIAALGLGERRHRACRRHRDACTHDFPSRLHVLFPA